MTWYFLQELQSDPMLAAAFAFLVLGSFSFISGWLIILWIISWWNK